MCEIREPEGSGKTEDPNGLTELDLDNKWYEAFADKVHAFGKSWPDPLTAEEYDACEEFADSQVRRPRGER